MRFRFVWDFHGLRELTWLCFYPRCTERGGIPKIKFEIEDDQPLADNDFVHFRAVYSPATTQWVAKKIRRAAELSGVVFVGSDKKLFIKSGRDQTIYEYVAVYEVGDFRS